MGIDVTHVTIIAPSPTVFAVNSHKLENVTNVTRDLLFELLLCMEVFLGLNLWPCSPDGLLGSEGRALAY